MHYSRKKVLLAAEYSRTPLVLTLNFPMIPEIVVRSDTRPWYAMAAYAVTEKLSVGTYRSQMIDHGHALGAARFSKDWDATVRYDFNAYLFAKAEEHFISGTRYDYDMTLNPNGLKPSTRFSILKAGVSF